MSEELEIIVSPLATSASALDVMTRSEIDVQISTAHKYPRSIQNFKKKALSMATLDEDTAASCFYVRPQGGKNIEGPSIRLAEIVAGAYGNLRFGARVTEITDTHVVAQGMAHDLEGNVGWSVEVRRGITGKNGQKYSADLIGTTANAACSIALRNAIFKAVPMALCKPIYEAAKKTAVGTVKTLASRREKMIDQFAKLGVAKEKVFFKVAVSGLEDIGLAELETLLGLFNAIKDGDVSIDETFSAPRADRFAKEEAPL